jgi:hypothetical protein
MELSLILPVALTVLLCSVIQGAVGFGFGLFSIPPMVWLGVPLPAAVMVTLVVTLVQGTGVAARLRRHVEWRAIAPVAALRMLLIPAGVLAMGLLVDLGQGRVKQAVGAALLLAVGMQWLLRPEPKDRVWPGWGVAAGGLSGLLMGTVGMGGPPCVLWALAHRWSGSQMRASLLAILGASSPVQMGLLYWRFGAPVARAGLVALCLVPLVALATAAGVRIGGRLATAHLRRVMVGLLVLLALASLLQPVL